MFKHKGSLLKFLVGKIIKEISMPSLLPLCMQVLRKAMKGLGTDDTKLMRVIVTRSEIDLHYIKAEYLKKYKKTLNDAVHSETSGHYRAFLLSLLGPNQ